MSDRTPHKTEKERVVEVLSAHHYAFASGGYCACGARVSSVLDGHDNHVADLVLAALSSSSRSDR